jgi:hypothetical protein
MAENDRGVIQPAKGTFPPANYGTRTSPKGVLNQTGWVPARTTAASGSKTDKQSGKR